MVLAALTKFFEMTNKIYIVEEKYRECVVIAEPFAGRKNGRFDLSKCTQKELKWLKDYAKVDYITEQTTTDEEQDYSR